MNRSIMIFSLAPSYGGGEKYLCDLVTRLNLFYIWKLAVCSQEIVHGLSELIEADSLRLISNSGRSSRVRSALLALSFAIRNKVDIVLLNGITEVKYSQLFKVFGIKTVGVIHTLQVVYQSGFARIVYLYNLRHCDSIVAVSNQVMNHYPREIVRKTRVIYNCVPIQPAKDIHASDGQKLKKVLFVGRIEKIKGIEDIYKLARIFQDVRFDLLGAPGGGDCDRNFLRNKPDNVELRGFCSNVFDYYSNSDLLLFPSRSEGGMPFVLLEAASIGLPIIASRIPAHEELADHIDGMRLYDPGDLDQLVRCFESLMESFAREEAGRRIHTSYLEFVKHNDFTSRYRQVFDRL